MSTSPRLCFTLGLGGCHRPSKNPLLKYVHPSAPQSILSIRKRSRVPGNIARLTRMVQTTNLTSTTCCRSVNSTRGASKYKCTRKYSFKLPKHLCQQLVFHFQICPLVARRPTFVSLTQLNRASPQVETNYTARQFTKNVFTPADERCTASGKHP